MLLVVANSLEKPGIASLCGQAIAQHNVSGWVVKLQLLEPHAVRVCMDVLLVNPNISTIFLGHELNCFACCVTMVVDEGSILARWVGCINRGHLSYKPCSRVSTPPV